MDSENVKRIACIGSGNVASSLLPALYGAGYRIVQVCSRNSDSAQRLAKMVGASSATSFANLDPNADVYIVAVSDDEIPNVLRDADFGDAMVVHMSGSTPMSIFEEYGVKRYGVLYPLQTFSRQRGVNFAYVPLYVEACSKADLMELMFIARKLSVDVYEADSENRMLLHIAAVFACNYSNHMLAIAAELVKRSGLNFSALKPLIKETYKKTLDADDPAAVQTGPAARGDMRIVRKHIEALANQPDIQQLYRLILEDIMKGSRS